MNTLDDVKDKEADLPRRFLPRKLTVAKPLRRTLQELGYGGELSADPSLRIAFSTDNSTYQQVPMLVATPASAGDLARLVRANRQQKWPYQMVARGGGTGTSGQALTEALLVDGSRLDRILEIDPERRRARVEPGVVLDRLNRELAPHGLFFAPHVSSGNRATIGGMVATDAAGKGSRIYGRTSDHVRRLKAVLASGETWTFEPLPLEEARAVARGTSPVAELYARLLQLLGDHQQAIEAGWPRLERGFTGYNVRGALAGGTFDPIRLICGSEGTLALVSEIELDLEPLPAHRTLVAVVYDDFLTALREVRTLLPFEPAAVEVMDERIQNLGRESAVWGRGVELLPAAEGSCLYVEFVDEEAEQLDRRLASLERWLERSPAVRASVVIRDAEEQRLLWRLRKDAVGLLARAGGEARPQAFVEDCAVPAERLADFVAEFRALLDARGLDYGMYGHADAGCIHVRPALDLSAPGGARELREISDQVAELVARHGGVLWGEHGRGFRGEYARSRLGEDLYALMVEVKRAFDPGGLLNPRKLYPRLADAVSLPRIDEVTRRAERDGEVTADRRRLFAPAFRCNGNALCHHHAPQELMCPSFHATGDFRQSPKGRADLVREWLRRRSLGTEDPALTAGLYASMNGCLSCKACTSGCPAEVDVPELKSRFLEIYHRDHPRPWREPLLLRLETLGPQIAPFASALDALLDRAPARRLLRALGIVEPPRFSRPDLGAELRERGDRTWTSGALERLGRAELERTVLLLPDAFTALYDVPTLVASYDLVAALGYRPRILELLPSGKYEHVKGYRRRFEHFARRQIERLARVSESGCPVVAVEPSVGLLFRQEYRQLVPSTPAVQLLQEWLVSVDPPSVVPEGEARPVQLFLHCSEAAALPRAGELWRAVFARAGLELEVVDAGCCGMAGVFGHELENQAVAERLFELSWRRPLDAAASPVATGFSCRSQVQRLAGRRIDHPAARLRRALVEGS